MIKTLCCFLSLSLLLTSCSTTKMRDIASDLPSLYTSAEIASTIESLKAEILSQKKEHATTGNNYFDMTAYLGTLYTSMYFLSLMWTDDYNTNPKYKELALKHRDLLYKTQTSSGGWYRVLDLNLEDPADVSASIMNYWFLKAINENIDSVEMKKARAYILSKGSLEKSDLLTKIFLSLFQNYSWDKTPQIPYLLFSKHSPINDRALAAWLSPHILPMAILRNIKVQKYVDSNLTLNELKINSREKIASLKSMKKSDHQMIKKLIDAQKIEGSWGGYLIASIFGRMALSYNILKVPTDTLLVSSKNKAQTFLDKYLFDVGESNFLGATQDGHIWDTALLAGALIEAGAKESDTHSSLSHILTFQNANGGFPFGYGFESTPDVDDTAEILITLRRVYEPKEPFITKGLNYLKNMQNDDGGFAAFSKNNNGNFLLKLFAKPFTDSADLFDESSPDVTGHVLEAYGHNAQTLRDSESVKKAIAYLRANQNESGAFFGRWGINYLYGTSAVITGLKEVGMNEKDPMVVKALNWLLSKQNKDGGFGESTLSYSKKEWEGVGLSTPSQTAWVIIALLKYLPAKHPSIEQAVGFLISNFKENNNTFVDQSVTGTGHPNVCYMVYPSYAKTFPLIALSRYLKIISSE